MGIDKEDEFCGNCLYWVPDGLTLRSGECRRHPPKVFIKDMSFFTAHPQCKDNKWCGEYEWEGIQQEETQHEGCWKGEFDGSDTIILKYQKHSD